MSKGFGICFRANALAIACAFSAAFAESYVSESCIDEIIELPGAKEDFDLAALPGDLLSSIGKAILFSSPDDEITDIGLSAGCVKELSKNPSGLPELLKSEIAPGIIKAAAADRLGISRKEIPSDMKKLKSFVAKLATKKAAELLETEQDKIPTNLQDLEEFIYKELRKQAAKKLSIDKSDIPKDKSQLSAFIKAAAKEKLEEESLISDEAESLMRAADAWDILRLMNGFSALTDIAAGEPIKISLKPGKKQDSSLFRIGLIAGASNSASSSIAKNLDSASFHGGLALGIGYFQTGLLLQMERAAALYSAEIPLMLSYRASNGFSLDAGAYLARGISQSWNGYGLKLGTGIEFSGGIYAGAFGKYSLAKTEQPHSVGVNGGYYFW